MRTVLLQKRCWRRRNLTPATSQPLCPTQNSDEASFLTPHHLTKANRCACNRYMEEEDDDDDDDDDVDETYAVPT